MTITCSGGSPHRITGCALLKYYADQGTGTISNASVMRAANDAAGGLITIEEQDYVLNCLLSGGNINTTCPGCYALPVTCIGEYPHYGNGCELLKHYAGSDGTINDTEANAAIQDGLAGIITNEEVDYVVNCVISGGNINTICSSCYTAPSHLNDVTFSPSPSTISSGSTTTFTAVPVDQYGSPISATVSWINSVSATGVINSSGALTGSFVASSTLDADTSTIITVTAVAGSYTKTAILNTTVLRANPALNTIEISPVGATKTVGSNQIFTATAKDQYQNIISGIQILWSSNDTLIGTVNPQSGTTNVNGQVTTTFSTLTTGTTGIIAINTSGTKSATASVTVTQAPPVFTSILVSPTTASVTVGNTQTFTAIARDQYNNEMTGISIAWNSDHPSIGSVNPNTGTSTVMTGLSTGITTITATSSGISGTSSVTVTATLPILHSIEISPTEITKTVGSSQIFTAIAKDSNEAIMSGVLIIWTNINGSVGYVSPLSGITNVNGQTMTTLSTFATGTTGVIARNASGNISASASVTISQVTQILTSISVLPTTASVIIGNTQSFTAVARDQNNNIMTGVSITWNSSYPLIGSIYPNTGSSTIMTGVSAGSTTLTATSGGIESTASATVTTAQLILTTITVTPTTSSVIIGNTQTFTAVARDQNNNIMTGVSIAWSSANPSIGTVSPISGVTDSNGQTTTVFSALSAGSTVITVLSGTVTNFISITVTASVAEAGMGGVGMIMLVGLGITALMSMKSPIR